MKKVICSQVRSLTDTELEMVSGGKGYDGCRSKPEKIHRGNRETNNNSRDWSGGCNSRP
ncbi:hypothetical protein ACQEXR_17270 [Vibrio sp. TRT 2004]